MGYNGKHDPDETVCTIRWTVQDIICYIEDNYDLEVTDEVIDRVLDNRCAKALKDRSIEEGWEILEYIVDEALYDYEEE